MLHHRKNVLYHHSPKKWAKGGNNSGCAGNGNTTAVPNYIQIGTDSDWSEQYSIGSSHVLAIKNNGTLWAWGQNTNGSCGIGVPPTAGQLIPTQVGTDANWAFVAADEVSSLGIKTDGTLWSWGSNYSGQLGIGSTVTYNQLSPIQVGIDTHWLKAYSAVQTCFAIKTDGTLWSWGSNGVGAKLGYLNSNINNAYRTPHIVNTDTNWTSVAVGRDMAIGLKTDGTLWAWGENGVAQFGNGTSNGTVTVAITPIQLGVDNDWKQITMSWNQCVALKNNDTRWGWGNNDGYELGDGTTLERTVPTQTDSNTDWIYVDIDTYSQGYGGNCIKQNNSLFHWGYNISIGAFNTIPTQEGTTCVLGNIAFENELLLSVFPNPTSDIITMSFRLEAPSKIKIKILNGLGQIILKEESNELGNDHLKHFDLSNCASGIYYLYLEVNLQSYQQKIIKH